MDDASGRPLLRSLSVGEIFDRAVTFYVRNFVVFTLTVLTLVVPMAFVQYFTFGASDEFARAMDGFRHPTSAQALHYTASQMTGIALVLLVAVFLAPYVNNAVAVGVATIYAGGKPSYATGFARVLQRWLPLLGTIVLTLLIFLGLYLGVFVAALVVGGVIGMLGAAIPVAGPIVAVVAVIALVIAAILAFLVLILWYAFVLYATTIERANPSHAIGEGFRRLFNRREFGKALLIALAYLAIEIAVILVIAGVSALTDLVVHSPVVDVIVNSLINAMLVAFLTVLVAVYYYDVRTRTEGLDLEADIERLTAPS